MERQINLGALDAAGLRGRCKLDLFDRNQDGQRDLAIGTGRRLRILGKAN
jgi:hypothetical protein